MSKKEEKQSKRKEKAYKKMEYKEHYLENHKFDLDAYRFAGNRHIFLEIIMILLFVAYFVYGGIMLYYAGDYILNLVTSNQNMIDVAATFIKEYRFEALVIFLGIYLITLWITYMVVKWFSKLAAWFLYGSFILEIGLFVALFFYVDWAYNWVFLIPAVIQGLILIYWRNKIQRAVEYVKISSMAIWKERHMLIPQFIQTVWIIFLSFFHFVTTLTTFLDLNTFDSVTIGRVIITDGWLYAIYSALFVFLVYIIMYSTIGMKQLMLHHWYRGGHLSYSRAYSMIVRRWRAFMGYALSSTIIHTIQFFYKLFKGEIKVTNAQEAAEVTKELTPDSPMSFDSDQGKSSKKDDKGKKKKLSLHERIWMGLNYFTLPAIAIEDKNFAPALWRSLKIVAKSIPDIYIKKAHVNKLFRVMQWASLFLIGILGALAGGVFGKFALGYSGAKLYAVVGIGISLFEWIGGMTAVLVLNDLNMAYITVMYIYTIDEENEMEGYNRFELEKQEKIEAKLNAKQKKKEEKHAKKDAKKK
jgi:hypothetical protein